MIRLPFFKINNSKFVSSVSTDFLLKSNFFHNVDRKNLEVGFKSKKRKEKTLENFRVNNYSDLNHSIGISLAIISNKDYGLENIEDIELFLETNPQIAVTFNNVLYISEKNEIFIVYNDALFAAIKDSKKIIQSETEDGITKEYSLFSLISNKEIQLDIIVNETEYIELQTFNSFNGERYGSDLYAKFLELDKSRTMFSLSYFYFQAIEKRL